MNEIRVALSTCKRDLFVGPHSLQTRILLALGDMLIAMQFFVFCRTLQHYLVRLVILWIMPSNLPDTDHCPAVTADHSSGILLVQTILFCIRTALLVFSRFALRDLTRWIEFNEAPAVNITIQVGTILIPDRIFGALLLVAWRKPYKRCAGGVFDPRAHFDFKWRSRNSKVPLPLIVCGPTNHSIAHRSAIPNRAA